MPNDCRLSDFRLELEQEVILSMLEFFKSVTQSYQTAILPFSDSPLLPSTNDMGSIKNSSVHHNSSEYVKARNEQFQVINGPAFSRRGNALLPSIVPIGAPWQQIYLLARRQKKIYVEMFDLAPINFSLRWAHVYHLSWVGPVVLLPQLLAHWFLHNLSPPF